MLPHVYENLTAEDSDADFYYQYYVQQGDFIRQGQARAAFSYAAKLTCLLAALWLLSATGVSFDSEGTTRGASVVNPDISIK
ncbi:hypothetical protein D3C72_2411080 [compost metagenome]